MLSQVLTQFGKFIASIVSFVVYIVSRFVKVIALIVIGAIAISIAAIVVSGHFGLPYLGMIAPEPAISGYIGYYAGMIALAIIPLIVLIKVAINFAGGYRTSFRFKRILGSVWVVSFIIFMLTGVFTVRNFLHEERVSKVLSEATLTADEPLQIEVKPLDARYNPRIQFSESVFLSNGQFFNREGVNVYLIPASDDKLKITRTESSRGLNKVTALRNRYYPSHNVDYSENLLAIDEFYVIGKRDKFRGQHFKYRIEIPVGTTLSLNNASPIFSNSEFRRRSSESVSWLMTEEGLQEIQEG